MIVKYKDWLVGSITKDKDNKICFEYSDEWRNKAGAFPISQSIPLHGDYPRGIHDHRFFVNLLPEAAARETICRGLGISLDNDYQLLKAIGGDCAGALQVLDEDDSKNKEFGYEPITAEILAKAINTGISYNRLNSGGKLRLSLAGAQEKWPVLFRDEKLFWPMGRSASSHILKFKSNQFNELHCNEAYTTFIYSKLRIPTVEIELKEHYTLTKRYDRYPSSEGEIERCHQEDFCQALAFSSYSKYESEGGPSFQALTELIRKISILPAKDIQNLIKWQIGNVLLGNSDGHGKNLSIVYTDLGPRLAPFYDLVNTGIYQGISKELAISIGGKHDPGNIYRQDWEQLAGQMSVNSRVFFRYIQSFSETLKENLDLYLEEFSDRWGNHSVLDRINQSIHRRIRRVGTLMG